MQTVVRGPLQLTVHAMPCAEDSMLQASPYLTWMPGKSRSRAFLVATLFRMWRCSSSARCTRTAKMGSPTLQRQVKREWQLSLRSQAQSDWLKPVHVHYN